MTFSTARFAVAIAGAVIVGHVSASLLVQIEPGDSDCYHVRVPPGRPSVMSGNYDLLSDDVDASSVSAWLGTAKRHTVWRSIEGQSEDTFSVTTEPETRYELCFNTKESISADESYLISVGFNLRVEPLPRTLSDEELGPDAKRALTMVESASFIENDWKNLLDHFDFLRNRDFHHDLMSTQILQRVMGWTVVEAILVVLMATGQVLYWRKFFEQRRYL